MVPSALPGMLGPFNQKGSVQPNAKSPMQDRGTQVHRAGACPLQSRDAGWDPRLAVDKRLHTSSARL